MTGTYEHSIDNAGRLIVPAKLREELGSTFYLAVGVKENLTLYRWPRGTSFRSGWRALHRAAASMDVFFASAQLCEADKQWPISGARLSEDTPRSTGTWSSPATTTAPRSGAPDSWKEKTRQQLNPENIAKLLEGLGI